MTEQSRMKESAFIHKQDVSHPLVTWRARATVAKCYGNLAYCDLRDAYEVVEADNNILMVSGANLLWTAVSGGIVTTPLNTVNTQIAVGDGVVVPANSDTDLSAALGAELSVSGLADASNTVPITITNGSGSWTTTPLVGQVVVVSGVTGNTGANGTWEVQAADATTITLLGSIGNGTFAGGTPSVKIVNKYRAQANGIGSVVISTNKITYVASYPSSVANFTWNEWGITTGAALTNKQATPPPLLFNRATPFGGLGTKTSAQTWTMTVVLALD